MHSGIVIDNQTLLFWGGVSPEMNVRSRIVERHRGELIMFDTQGNWAIAPETFGDIPRPGYRNGHRLVLDNESKFAYLIGGTPNDGNFQLDVHELVWKKLKDCEGLNRIHPAVASVPGFIFIFGGKKADGRSTTGLSDLFRLNTTTLTTERVECKGAKPPGRSSACMESVKGRFLILFGGDRSTSVCCDDLWIFDTKTHVWTEIKCSRPKPVGLGTSGFAKYIDPDTNEVAKLFFYGGLCISGEMKNDIWCLDVGTLKWRIVKTGSSKMIPLSHHTNLIAGTKLYLYGGTDILIPTNIIDTVYSFDFGHMIEKPTTCDWTCYHCGTYTTKKCSKCKSVQFCSNQCEVKAASKHELECTSLSGGDEISIRFRKHKAQYNMLLKINEERNSIIASNQERIENLEDMFRQTNRLLQEKESVFQYTSSQKEKLERELESKSRQIIECQLILDETFQQSDLQKQQLKTKITELTKDKTGIETKLQKNQSKVGELEKQVQKLKNSLNRTNSSFTRKMEELQQHVDKSKEENMIQSQILEQAKKELEQMKGRLQEVEGNNECPICYNNERNCALHPCGHVLCSVCAEHQKKHFKGLCPFCRQKFTSTVNIFL